MSLDPKFRDKLRALGAPEDPVATNVSSSWSAMSLLKAIYAAITDGTLASGVAAAADGVIKTAVASAVAQANLAAKRAMAISTGAAASAFQAESFATFVRGAVAQCAQYMRLARSSKIAAAASAVSTAADAATTAAAAAQSVVAVDAANLVSGNAMLGQRAKKDRVASAASAAAAAASAASVPTVEQSILGIQVYS